MNEGEYLQEKINTEFETLCNKRSYEVLESLICQYLPPEWEYKIDETIQGEYIFTVTGFDTR